MFHIQCFSLCICKISTVEPGELEFRKSYLSCIYKMKKKITENLEQSPLNSLKSCYLCALILLNDSTNLTKWKHGIFLITGNVASLTLYKHYYSQSIPLPDTINHC